MTERVQIQTPSGKTAVAELARPTAATAPGLILIHEWWGLNWEMEHVAGAFAKDGYLALAIDMFQGKVTDQPADAQKLMDEMDTTHAAEALAGWIAWLRKSPACNGRVGTLGYCLGGAWSLNASIATPVEATVIYHGKVDKTAEQLATLKGPVLGHFALKETYIPPESARAFEQAMRTAGKKAEVHFYDAGHAFTRPKGPNFHKPSADLAWSRSLEFLGRELGAAK